jgi:cobaltochelatase CobS
MPTPDHSYKNSEVKAAMTALAKIPNAKAYVRAINLAHVDDAGYVVLLPDIAFRQLVENNLQGFESMGKYHLSNPGALVQQSITTPPGAVVMHSATQEIAVPGTNDNSLNDEDLEEVVKQLVHIIHRGDPAATPVDVSVLEAAVTDLATHLDSTNTGLTHTNQALAMLRDSVAKLAKLEAEDNKRASAWIDQLAKELYELADDVKKQQATSVQVEWLKPTTPAPKTKVVQSAPPVLAQILSVYASGERNIYLWGEAGTGKSYLPKLAAEALGFEHYTQSFCADTGTTELLGWIQPNGDYRSTPWSESYRKPSIMQADEWDNLDPAVGVMLNDGIENNRMYFPDAILPIERDPQQLVIATGNTTMRGATVSYSARSRHDQSTVQRWIYIEVEYDDTLTRQLVGAILPKQGAEIVDWGNKVRSYLKAENIPSLIVSMRELCQFARIYKETQDEQFSLDGAIWKGYTPKVVAEIVNACATPIRSNP